MPIHLSTVGPRQFNRPQEYHFLSIDSDMQGGSEVLRLRQFGADGGSKTVDVTLELHQSYIESVVFTWVDPDEVLSMWLLDRNGYQQSFCDCRLECGLIQPEVLRLERVVLLLLQIRCGFEWSFLDHSLKSGFRFRVGVHFRRWFDCSVQPIDKGVDGSG